jgi:hypothetical protein
LGDVAKKLYRPKRIGDPLKKFKQTNIISECPPEVQSYFEKTMEEDHRAGLPFRAAIVTQDRSGFPDPWFFNKARDLGYGFDSEQEFHKAQLQACFITADRIPEYVKMFEQYMRFEYKEDFEQAIKNQFGSLDNFKTQIELMMRDAQSQGKPCTIGKNLGKRTSRKRNQFLGNNSTMMGIKK